MAAHRLVGDSEKSSPSWPPQPQLCPHWLPAPEPLCVLGSPGRAEGTLLPPYPSHAPGLPPHHCLLFHLQPGGRGNGSGRCCQCRGAAGAGAAPSVHGSRPAPRPCTGAPWIRVSPRTPPSGGWGALGRLGCCCSHGVGQEVPALTTHLPQAQLSPGPRNAYRECLGKLDLQYAKLLVRLWAGVGGVQDMTWG